MTIIASEIPETAKRPLLAAGTRRFRSILIGVAALAAVGCLVAAMLNPKQFYFRYLAAVMLLVSVGAGSLFWLLLHYLTSASWSTVMRRLIEHCTLILLPGALLFVPLLFGLTELFSWSAHDLDPVIAAKRGYLNGPFFLVRAVGYFSVWIGLAVVFRRRSLGQDRRSDGGGLEGLERLCAPAMILLAVSTTFAAFDWIMSLEPHWHSNIFGVYFWAGSFSGSLSVITLIALWARTRPHLERVITVEHLQDLGKLHLGFVSFWAYIAFSQYLLIWYANIPEETAWFEQRTMGGWGEASVVLGVGHFLVPFLVLLPRRAKRSPIVLSCVSVWLLAFHAFDLCWQILPTLGAEAHLIHWIDPFAWTLVVAVALWTVVTAAVNHPLAPVGDLRLSASIAFENE